MGSLQRVTGASVGQSVGHCRSLTWLLGRAVGISLSVGRSCGCSVTLSVVRSVGQLLDWSLDRSVGHLLGHFVSCSHNRMITFSFTYGRLLYC